MLHHAIGFAPFRLPAGAQAKMAFFRAHDAAVAGGQLSETRIAVALTETLFGGAIAMNTANHAIKIQPHLMTNKVIQGNAFVADSQVIGHRVAGLGRHLTKPTGYINGFAQTLTSTN